jgi:hypothetical protein
VHPRELNSGEFQEFQDFIYRHSGIHIPDTKRSLLSNRVRRRLKAGEFDGFQSYFNFLTSAPGLIRTWVNESHGAFCLCANTCGTNIGKLWLFDRLVVNRSSNRVPTTQSKRLKPL